MSLEVLEAGEGPRDYGLERLSILQDGVFAIAMTLLALDLKPPSPFPDSVGAVLSGMSEPLTAYAYSFGFVCVYWVRQKATFSRLVRADNTHTILCLLLLALVTLSPAAARAAVAVRLSGAGLQIWLALLSLMGLVLALQWVHAAFLGDLLRPEVSRAERVEEAIAQLVVPIALAAVVSLSMMGRLRSTGASLLQMAALVAAVRGALRWRARRRAAAAAAAGA